MSSEDAEKLAALKLKDVPEEQSTTDTSGTSDDKAAEQSANTNKSPAEETRNSGESEKSLTEQNDSSSEKADFGEPFDDTISDKATIDRDLERLNEGSIPLASGESDLEGGELEPSNDYERFLQQYSNADSARRMILHSINARVAEHEHKANCWKVVQADDSSDLKKLFEIFMRKDGAPTIDEFEDNAFMKSYATPEYIPDTPTTAYAEYMEQFLPGIPIRNYFPELGAVGGEVPYCMSTDTDMMNQQPPIILDPSSYEVQFKIEKVEKVGQNKKKTTTIKTEEIQPQQLFLKEDLELCVAVPEWAERYCSRYSFQPAKELILRELNPKRYKNVIVPSRAVECGLISREFDTVLAEYKKSTNPQMLTLAPELAKKYIEKRLEQFKVPMDPTLIETYKKMKAVLNDEIVAAVNAINRYRSDEKKFDRLEKILYIKYYDL